MLDWSVRIGDILQIVGFAAVGVGFFMRLTQKIEQLGLRLGFIEQTVAQETTAQNKKLDELGALLVNQARYEERLIAQQNQITLCLKQLDEIKHGQGFINGPRLANAGNP